MKNNFPIITTTLVDFLLRGLVSLEAVQNELVTTPSLFSDVRALYLARRNFKEAYPCEGDM